MLQRTRLLGAALPSSCVSLHRLSSATAPKPRADASAVVDLLLRPIEGGGDRNEEELCALLSSAPYTPSHLLQVIRSLPNTDAALRFFDWCRGQQSTSAPSACAVHGPSAYQAIFELAAQEEGPELPHLRMKGLLDKSTEQGYSLTSESAALLVRAFGKARMFRDAILVFRNLEPHLRKTSICNDLLRSLFGSNDPHHRTEALTLVRDMIRNSHPKCSPDPATGSIVYYTLIRRSQIMDGDSVRLVVELAEHRLFPSDALQFAQLINKLCRSGHTGGAWDFLHSVKNAGGAVEAPPCNSLLTGLGRDRDFLRMNMLLAEMEEMGVKRNVITFGILINHLCKSRRIDDALRVLDSMTTSSSSESSVSPDVVIFNTIIDGLCKAGRLEDGLSMLDWMKVEHKCLPNTVTYNSLIDGFCKAGEIDWSHELLARMNDEGIPPNVVTLNTLIDGMCRHGRISSALEFFRQLQCDAGVDVEGNAVTYSTLIGAFLHANNVNKATELFEEMLRSGHNPDAVTYFTLISGLSQAGRLDEAYSVASKMENDGFSLDTKSYNILIAGFCKKKKLDKARDLLDEMGKKGLKPDVVTFNTLIATSSKLQDFSSAQLLMSKMIEKGYKPSVITYGALIHGYCRAGDMDEAMNIFRTMDAAGIPPNTVIYNILIDFLSKAKEPGAALSLMDEMRDRGVPPTTATYNAMFKGLQEKNLLDEAFELMDRMKEHSCNADYITMEILTEWLSSVGEVARLRNFIQGNEIAKSSI